MDDRKICSRCKEPKPLTEFGPDRRRKLDGLKAVCRACDRDIHRLLYMKPDYRRRVLKHNGEYYTNYRKQRLKARHELGLCYFCDSPVLDGKTRCATHDERALQQQRKRGREYGAKCRRLVFEHYGDKCECCGESQRLFLSVDHINGGGAQHRREIFSTQGQKRKSGFLYPWLVRNNFPEGFRILCFNCNCGRERNGGICPHKSVTKD